MLTEDRLVHVLASAYFWPGADYDDRAQEARYALERARRRFDPERGCDWLSFAFVAVKHHLIEQVRRETQRRPQFAYLADVHPSPHALDEVVEARERVRGIVAADLSPLERRALLKLVNGEPFAHDKSLDNALCRARRKLRNAA